MESKFDLLEEIGERQKRANNNESKNINLLFSSSSLSFHIPDISRSSPLPKQQLENKNRENNVIGFDWGEFFGEEEEPNDMLSKVELSEQQISHFFSNNKSTFTQL